MIKEYRLKKAIDISLETARKFLKESGSTLLSSAQEIEESIRYHLQSVKNWSKEVSFSDLKKAKLTTEIFIDLDLLVFPRRYRFGTSEPVESIHLKRIFDSSNDHFIILGQPGAGKTTSMKYLCQSLFYDPEFYSDSFSFPILIRLRDLNNIQQLPESSFIIDHLTSILGLRIDFPLRLLKLLKPHQVKSIKEKLIFSLLDELQVLLILDGFDELALSEDREEAIDQIRKLAYQLDRSTLIVTSRTGDFVYNIDNTAQYEICPLTKEQISTFSTKWLSDSEKAADFLAKVYDSPFADTAIRPLTLAHLTAIYEREGRIPDKPKTIYRKIINLLLEEWDQQRSIKRYSRYASFEVDRKFEFLCNLGYLLTIWLEKTVFSKQDLLTIYERIYDDYGLIRQEAQQVVNEIETHTGLLLQSGYESFEFAHKSLQEFLTAEYLVRLPSIPSDIRQLSKIPNELAIGVTVSSKPNLYFSELVSNRLVGKGLSEDFFKAFLSRLFLEKPDFTSTPQFCSALIALYSLSLDRILASDLTLAKLSNETAIIELEKLMDLMLTKHSINVIKELYYDSRPTYGPEGPNKLYRMIRKNNARSPEPLNLPTEVYLRQKWLKM